MGLGVFGERFSLPETNGNPVTGVDPSAAGSMGSLYNFYQGWYQFGRVELLPGDWQYIFIDTEAINPLYTGSYSVGPYRSKHRPAFGQQSSGEVGDIWQLSGVWVDRRQRRGCRWDLRGQRRERVQSTGGCGDGLVDGAALRLWSHIMVFVDCAGQPQPDDRGHR